MCRRRRNTANYLKIVGEVRHGFAIGYIWECEDVKECDAAIESKLSNPTVNEWEKEKINFAVEHKRFTEYIVRT